MLIGNEILKSQYSIGETVKFTIKMNILYLKNE